VLSSTGNKNKNKNTNININKHKKTKAKGKAKAKNSTHNIYDRTLLYSDPSFQVPVASSD